MFDNLFSARRLVTRHILGRVLTVCTLLVAWCGLASGAGQFPPFEEEPINRPGSYELIDDPTGSAPTPQVYSFTVIPGECSTRKHADGSSDCKFNSVRSQLFERAKKQPQDAWYSFYMYLPKDFPIGAEQTGTGFYNLAYLHDGDCPNVTLASETAEGGKLVLQINKMGSQGKYGCLSDTRIEIADLETLRGAWHRFEISARWSTKDDGRADVFIDGKRVGAWRGPTLMSKAKPNYFKFGIYLCCTKGVETITKATAYYADVIRADTLSGLFTEADVPAVKDLQTALNTLGCDTGTPDGVVGKRTREMALSCRAIPEDQLPLELTPGSLRTFVDLYSRTDVAALPPGDLDQVRARAENVLPPLPPGVIAPTFLVTTKEDLSHTKGIDYQINTALFSVIRGAPDVKEISFSVFGTYQAPLKKVVRLQLFLNQTVKSAKKLEACPNSSITFPDGSVHAAFQFKRNGGTFVATNLDCLLKALSDKEAAEVAFLVDHFTDIAIGTVIDGSADKLQHTGLADFMRGIAMGEITVGRAPAK